MDCHAAEQINWTFGIWIMFSFTIHWTASNEEHDNHASNQLNTYPDLMPATESCRGVNDTYPDLWILYGSAIPCTVTPIDNGQLSLREVITQEWIHAEKCTLLVNTCRGLRQVFTPRRIHFARVLLASLARSLRSHSGLRPEAFGLSQVGFELIQCVPAPESCFRGLFS